MEQRPLIVKIYAGVLAGGAALFFGMIFTLSPRDWSNLARFDLADADTYAGLVLLILPLVLALAAYGLWRGARWSRPVAMVLLSAGTIAVFWSSRGSAAALMPLIVGGGALYWLYSTPVIEWIDANRASPKG